MDMTHDRSERLRELMKRHRLSCKLVGEMLGRSIQTVRSWRMGREKQIPPQLLELLEHKLAPIHPTDPSSLHTGVHKVAEGLMQANPQMTFARAMEEARRAVERVA